MTPDGAQLRSGLTTGTCAAAAAGAAALALAGESPDAVEVALPDGERVTLAVQWLERPREGCARAAVLKDAGDDPDVTDGMTVVVEVERLAGAAPGAPDLELAAGPGVGTVTRAGLQIPPGEPAINPVPREMIAAAIRAALPDGALRVTVSIPGGEETAKHTFNSRLGIEGGLSLPYTHMNLLGDLVESYDLAMQGWPLRRDTQTQHHFGPVQIWAGFRLADWIAADIALLIPIEQIRAGRIAVRVSLPVRYAILPGRLAFRFRPDVVLGFGRSDANQGSSVQTSIFVDAGLVVNITRELLASVSMPKAQGHIHRRA